MEFPFPKIRSGQKELIDDCRKAFAEGKHLLAHAPTGIGKTAAVVLPAVEAALEGKTVFFLTPKHSQHQIVIDTLKLVRKKAKISAVDFIGKQWMCPVEGSNDLRSGEFADYCASVRKDDICGFFNSTYKKGQLRRDAAKRVGELLKQGPLHVEEACELAEGFCPYEIMCHLGRKASFVVCDYYHLLNPDVGASFLFKLDKELSNSIIIVDEAQNLPDRVRSLLSERISSIGVRRAIKEADDYGFDEIADLLGGIKSAISKIGKDLEKQKLVGRKEFIEAVQDEAGESYSEIVASIETAAKEIREKQRRSFCGGVVTFLNAWQGSDDGYVRVMSARRFRNKKYLSISYKCLDPAIATKETFEKSHSTVLMSGTLTPMEMYIHMLGLKPERTIAKQYKSPFKSENRLNLVVPTVTTKYSRRNQGEYEKIGDICSAVIKSTPGNLAIFFPSYLMKENIRPFIDSDKILFDEERGAKKKEKNEFLQRFARTNEAVLLGVAGGSLSEGVDFAKNILKAVIVVGLPLDNPTLEVKALISYYDKKFKRGWDYGYIYPAINKAIQASGRMIRGEGDRGVAIFMDERYTWSNYKRCFPPELRTRIASEPEKWVRKFWSRKA